MECAVELLFEYSFYLLPSAAGTLANAFRVQAAIQCLYAALDRHPTAALEIRIRNRLSRLLLAYTRNRQIAASLCIKGLALSSEPSDDYFSLYDCLSECYQADCNWSDEAAAKDEAHKKAVGTLTSALSLAASHSRFDWYAHFYSRLSLLRSVDVPSSTPRLIDFSFAVQRCLLSIPNEPVSRSLGELQKISDRYSQLKRESGESRFFGYFAMRLLNIALLCHQGDIGGCDEQVRAVLSEVGLLPEAILVTSSVVWMLRYQLELILRLYSLLCARHSGLTPKDVHELRSFCLERLSDSTHTLADRQFIGRCLAISVAIGCSLADSQAAALETLSLLLSQVPTVVSEYRDIFLFAGYCLSPSSGKCLLDACKLGTSSEMRWHYFSVCLSLRSRSAEELSSSSKFPSLGPLFSLHRALALLGSFKENRGACYPEAKALLLECLRSAKSQLRDVPLYCIVLASLAFLYSDSDAHQAYRACNLALERSAPLGFDALTHLLLGLLRTLSPQVAPVV